jgi:hypothetical protein
MGMKLKTNLAIPNHRSMHHMVQEHLAVLPKLHKKKMMMIMMMLKLKLNLKLKMKQNLLQ